MSSVAIGPHLNGGKKGMLAALQLVTPLTSKSYSSDTKFLSKIESTALRRGRGGRSSFSGVVATVFGATGFTGKYVCSKLGRTGTQMIIPYRCDQYDTRHLKVCGDLGQVLFMPFNHVSEEDKIKKAMKHSQVVINLIGNDFETINNNFTQTNVDTARTIAKCAREMGIERLIHVSSLNVFENHEGYYTPGGSKFLKTKGEGELAVREEFPDAIIFRPSDIWGQEDRFLKNYVSLFRRTLKAIGIPHGGKGVWKQPVAVSDFAQGVVNAITSPEAPGNTYEIVGPRRYELGELVEYIHRILRRDYEDWGHVMFDLKFDPTFKFRVKMAEKLPTGAGPYGNLSLDKIEREAISDNVTGLPNLEDLGVKMTILEDVAIWELKQHRAYGYYNDKVGEYEEPAPPKFIAGH